MEGIEYFSRIEGPGGLAGSMVGFGGATQIDALPRLKEAGFKSVINLRLATEKDANVEGKRAAAEAAGLNYIHMPMQPKDTDQHYVAEFLAAVEDPENQPVYIHCHSATRVAALWMILRVLEDGWDVGKAREEAEGIAGRPEEAIAFANYYIATHGK